MPHLPPRRAAAVAILAAALLAVMPLAAQQPARPAPPRDYSAPPGAPYTAEEVRVPTPEGHVLAGTLTLPHGASRERPVPVVVTVTGSGGQDRDEYMGIEGYRPFRQFADSLGRRGIGVLRMDDRGTAASGGTFRGATSADFANDILAGLAWLRSRPEVRGDRLAVVGHSEGALIAPMVADRDPSVRAIALLAGVARSGRSILLYQLRNLAERDTTLSAARRDSVIAAIPGRIDSLRANNAWMQFFIDYDPLVTARRVTTPALIVTGSTDQQTSPDQVAEQAAAFREAGNRDVTAQVIPGVNHLFVEDPDGFPLGYRRLPPPVRVAPQVVGLVVDWLAARLLAPAGTASAVPAGRDTAFDARAHYTKREHMVPMRDGVRLYTIVYAPRDTTRSYPVILFRTPYSIGPYEPDAFRTPLGPSPEFDREGYIFVFQDVRGKFRSEGEFEVMRPFRRVKRTPRDVDESSDAYDTIEWVLKNVPRNTGRVGMWGISYPAWQTVMAMMNAHPALKAASPQASPSDMFIGDDFHHNGAFRLMYAFSWLAGNARTRTGQTTTRGRGFDYGTPDGYRFFMEAGAPARIDSLYFRGEVPAWNDFMRHPDYDAYWQAQNVLKDLNTVPADLPVLHVAGWFDAEDFYGPMSIYYTLEKLHPRNRGVLAVGPWLHGGWRSMPGDQLGHIRFGSPTSRHFQREVQFPFFQCHLKGICGAPPAEATVFTTGSNAWQTHDVWPPREAKPRTLYFHPGGRLAFTPPGGTGYDEYVHDPAKPVPFSAETRTTQGHLWMVEDQRFAARRPDVLVYETEPLTEDVTIAGPVIARLMASTSGTDADFVVKLIDVYPGDAPDNDPNPTGTRMGHFQMLVAGEVMRAKYRQDPAKPAPMVPGRVTAIEFDLRDRNHTFRKGHRIMVQVQSSWFPVIDRNPGIFTDIYHAKPADYRRTTQRIHWSPGGPSGITVQVIPSPGG